LFNELRKKCICFYITKILLMFGNLILCIWFPLLSYAFYFTHLKPLVSLVCQRIQGRKRQGRKGGREEGRQGRREGGKKGGREEGREGRREGGREGGRKLRPLF
jgi:hypothetical protein